MIEHPDSPDTPHSHLPFSPVTKVGNLLFVSGQASVDGTGKIISDTIEGEIRRSIENLEKVLKTAGSDLKHVVRTCNYVRLHDDIAEFNRVYLEYFSKPFPARTTISGCLSPALRYEIDCIAVVAEKGEGQ